MDSNSNGTATLPPPDEVALVDEVTLVKERERAGRDLGARTYLEKLERSRGPFRFRAELRTLVHFIRPRRGQDVLDAGSGVGRYALSVASRVRRLVCADLSPVALDVLRERAAAHGLANIETRVCDLAELPAELGPFDTIYSSEVLQHVPGYDEHLRVMHALHRALKPGGRCLMNVVCWNRRSHSPKVITSDDNGMYWHRFSTKELRELFLAAGFRHVSLRGVTLLPGSMTRRMSPRLAMLETLASRFAPFAGHGRLLLGIARR